MWGAILSWLRLQIGQRSDAASSTGSAHAKIKNIVDNVLPTIQKPRGGIRYTYGPVSDASYVTALSVSGKGRLVRLILYASGSAANDTAVKVTIDGNLVCAGHLSSSTNGYYLPNFAFLFLTSDANPGFSSSTYANPDARLDLSFDTSLLIEAKKISGSAMMTIICHYEVE